MKVVGLTGPTGAGKSFVCSLMGEWDGVSIIDCDKIARRVTVKGHPCLVDIAIAFSPKVIDPWGELKRKTLAEMVFGDDEKLKQLNEIIFPYIMVELKKDIEIARESGAHSVIVDAPTLFDSGADKLCDMIVVVLAKSGTRLNRVMERDALTAEQVAQRMHSQQEDEFFRERADFVIENNENDVVSLRLQVLELLNYLSV